MFANVEREFQNYYKNQNSNDDNGLPIHFCKKGQIEKGRFQKWEDEYNDEENLT